MNMIKTLKSYALYTLLCLCSFAFIYAITYWVSNDLYWYKEMLETDYGRASFAQIFVLTSGLSALVCLLVWYIKQNN